MSAPKAYWQLERFATYADSLVRYYSRRSDFTTRLTTSIDTACVILSRKQVLINPAWEPCGREHLSRVRVRGHDRLVLTLIGLAAHEAAHIRFSGDWPGGLLGQLVNSLEDERIERLQAADFPLSRAFDFLGDYTLLAAEQNESFYSAQAGILLWRFQHDFPHDVWHTDEEAWDLLRPLVERAWVAQDTDEVIEIARKIMAILGLDEDTPEDTELTLLGLSGDHEAAPKPGAGETLPPGGAGTRPYEPRDDLQALADLEGQLELARPLASQLERVLKTPYRAERELSRSRGRLNVRRVLRGEARPFEVHVETPHKPLRIFLAQDLSSSMGSFVPEHAHYHAVLTALALELACSRLKVPFALIGFEDVATLERPFGMARGEALLKVGSLASGGGTVLADALQLIAKKARPDDLVFILCDGFLADLDVTRSRTLAARMRATLIPILIGENAGTEQFQRIFGRVCHAACAQDIPAVVKRVLMAARAGG